MVVGAFHQAIGRNRSPNKGVSTDSIPRLCCADNRVRPCGGQAFGPESFSTLQRSVKDDVVHPSLGLVVQLLRLSRLDPDVFMKFRATVVDQVLPRLTM